MNQLTTRPRLRRTGPVRPARLIRKLTATEQPLLAEHLLRLSPHDRSMRFMSTVTDAHVVQYTERTDHQRLVLGYFADGVMRGAGELIFLANPAWRGACEAALSVEPAWQHLGVGTELLQRLVVFARNRGAAPLEIHFLRENRRMQGLARKFGMTVVYDRSDVSAQLQPAWPNYLTLLGESFTDGHAFWARWVESTQPVRQ